MPQIAASFAAQTIVLPVAAQQYVVRALVASVYQHLLGRAPDAAGEAFWRNAIATGAVSLPNVVLAISNGAQGAHATVLGFKLEAAGYFTAESIDADQNATSRQPPSPVFFYEANAAVAGMVDAGMVDFATTVASKGASYDNLKVFLIRPPSTTSPPMQQPDPDGLLLGT